MNTSAIEVAKIIDVADGVDLTPFMEASNELVVEKCSDADYTVARLVKIETWLAAHFYACSLNLQPTSERAGSVASNYQGRTDLGFDLTHYGQMAMRLDTAGGLASLNQEILSGKRKVAGITWLGTETEDETDEE